jgi:hypothetical protein
MIDRLLPLKPEACSRLFNFSQYYALSFFVAISLSCTQQKDLIALLDRTQHKLEQCQIENSKQLGLKEGLGQLQKTQATLANQACEQIIHQIDANTMVKLAQSIGSEALPNERNILIYFGEIKAYLVIFPGAKELSLFAKFQGFHSTLDFVNEWNKTQRFSKAYIDENGETILDSDLDLESGVTEENIKSWIRLFGITVNHFNQAIEQYEKKYRSNSL